MTIEGALTICGVWMPPKVNKDDFVHFRRLFSQPTKAAHQRGELAIGADGVGVVAEIADDLQEALLAGGRMNPGGPAPAQQPPPGHWSGGRSNKILGKDAAAQLQSITLGSGRRVADRHRRVARATQPKRCQI